MAASAAQLLNINPPLTAQERATRSVFVGNIPYEATEEQLKEIFTQAGPVVSFRLVYDRETGKPKGYGFCEYLDLETAQSAMRNLNNHDFNGRPLRVGVAAGEQSKDEIKGMQQAVGGAPIESPYGEPVETEKAPEAISKAVASLPPEQMFELMKQMKLCIQNNPTEARSMLLQNPQLAYALLQAQIVMKIVDPQVALAMLYRDPNQVPSVTPVSNGASHVTPTSTAPMDVGPPQGRVPPGGRGPGMMSGPPRMSAAGGDMMPGPQGMMQAGPQGPMQAGPQGPMQAGPQGQMQAGPQGQMQNRPDMGGPFHGAPGPPRADTRDPRLLADPRSIPRPGVAGVPIRGPAGPGPGHLGAPGPVPASQLGVLGQLGNLGNLNALSQLGLAGGLQLSGLAGQVPAVTGAPGTQISAQDQEKAALIMQVLQLTDQQIAMLPPDQRQSILILKEQISQSGQ